MSVESLELSTHCPKGCCATIKPHSRTASSPFPPCPSPKPQKNAQILLDTVLPCSLFTTLACPRTLGSSLPIIVPLCFGIRSRRNPKTIFPVHPSDTSGSSDTSVSSSTSPFHHNNAYNNQVPFRRAPFPIIVEL